MLNSRNSRFTQPPPTIWRRFRRWAAIVIGLIAVLGGVSYLAFVERVPRPPTIATAGVDPAVAKLINATVEEVVRARRSGDAWGQLGSVLMHYEFIQETRFAFEQAEKLSPHDSRWPYLHALVLMNSAPDAAVTKLGRAVQLAPEKSDMPRLRFAQFLLERGRHNEAELHFQALLRHKADHAPALLGLARLSQQSGRLADSTNFLTHACLRDPHTAKNANAVLAVAQKALGNVSAAEVAALRSASLPADQPWPDRFWDEAARYRVGRKALTEDASAFIDQGRLADASQLLSQLTRDYPENEEGWYLMGWLFNQQHQFPEAERALREHTSSRSPKALAQLAVALLNQKRLDEAIDVLQAALQLKPTWRELHYNLGYACAQLGRTNEAIIHLRNALERDPNYVPGYNALAELLIGRGETNEARRLLSQALDLSPSHPRASALLKRIQADR